MDKWIDGIMGEFLSACANFSYVNKARYERPKSAPPVQRVSRIARFESPIIFLWVESGLIGFAVKNWYLWVEKVWEKLKGDGSYGGPNFKAEIQGRIIEERRRNYAIGKMMTNKIDIDWGRRLF